jgi:16S rRNA (guanine527-N7)-methyltransferase
MDTIRKYFSDLDAETDGNFAKMMQLYREWNSSVNLISRKDIDFLEIHHILHSLAIAKCVQFPKNAEVLDMGTGGGFPGIPLALLFPDTKFTLMDSIGKKIMVVQDIAQKLELKNVEAVKARSNEYKLKKFDFIISRAVSSLPQFYADIKHLINKPSQYAESGIYYLKGGDFSDELDQFRKHKIFPIKNMFTEEYFQTKYVVYIKF